MTTRYRVRWIAGDLLLASHPGNAPRRQLVQLAELLSNGRIRAQIIEAGYVDLPLPDDDAAADESEGEA